MRIIKAVTVLSMLCFIMTSCSGTIHVTPTEDQSTTIVGEWLSFSVENKDPFFKDIDFPENIKVTFTENGNYEWVDYTIKGRNINIETYSTGSYRIDENNKIIVHDERLNEDMICDIMLEPSKLTLTTDDGFIFKFDRIL